MQFEVKVLRVCCISNTPADGVGLELLQSFMGLRGCRVLISVLALTVDLKSVLPFSMNGFD